ncbi:MAG: toll/interleukin-1 receptor domain-containing protein [Clostridia bacterium]|nr:toll/interleukin-1 receptor domain-containing protein [Clostridia bacterium]
MLYLPFVYNKKDEYSCVYIVGFANQFSNPITAQSYLYQIAEAFDDLNHTTVRLLFLENDINFHSYAKDLLENDENSFVFIFSENEILAENSEKAVSITPCVNVVDVSEVSLKEVCEQVQYLLPKMEENANNVIYEPFYYFTLLKSIFNYVTEKTDVALKRDDIYQAYELIANLKVAHHLRQIYSDDIPFEDFYNFVRKQVYIVLTSCEKNYKKEEMAILGTLAKSLIYALENPESDDEEEEEYEEEYVKSRMIDDEDEVVEEEPISAPTVSEVQFSAISQKKLEKGDYSLIDVIMYEEAYRFAVDNAIREAEEYGEVKETSSGVYAVEDKTVVKVVLTSPDIEIDDNVSESVWYGKYQKFSFDIYLPEDYSKKKILFTAQIYFNGVLATRLKILADCSGSQAPVKCERYDITNAFISYASQDRNVVSMIVQGLRKARPDLNVFFDVETLRSGESWENELRTRIDGCDVLYLCWSHNAMASKWVDYEWRYAYQNKGIDCIEPIPLEEPSICQPPQELASKHFNDLMLYIRK